MSIINDIGLISFRLSFNMTVDEKHYYYLPENVKCFLIFCLIIPYRSLCKHVMVGYTIYSKPRLS